MKYDISTILNLIVYPVDETNLTENPSLSMPELVSKLSEGYEIYSAIPFSTNSIAGIQYILRKERNK